MRPNKSQHLQQQTDNINFGDDVYIILQKVRMAQRIQQNIAWWWYKESNKFWSVATVCSDVKKLKSKINVAIG